MNKLSSRRHGLRNAAIGTAIAAGVATAAYAASYVDAKVDVRTDDGFIKINGTTQTSGSIQNIAGDDLQFVVQDNSNSGSTLDPRVEMVYEHKILPGAGTITFKGDYTVISAKDTTIAQLLKFDDTKPEGSPDRTIPELFIAAERRTSDGKVRICERLCSYSTSRLLRDWGSAIFRLTIEADGNSAKAKVDSGSWVSVSWTPKTNVAMRVGAYHHDTTTLSGGKKRANSKADVKVSNSTFSN